MRTAWNFTQGSQLKNTSHLEDALINSNQKTVDAESITFYPRHFVYRLVPNITNWERKSCHHQVQFRAPQAEIHYSQMITPKTVTGNMKSERMGFLLTLVVLLHGTRILLSGDVNGHMHVDCRLTKLVLSVFSGLDSSLTHTLSRTADNS
jgi:hypothetical protein